MLVSVASLTMVVVGQKTHDEAIGAKAAQLRTPPDRSFSSAAINGFVALLLT